jgi:hypothetical protein
MSKSHDLNNPIFLKDFLNLYDESHENVTLKIVVDGVEYMYTTKKIDLWNIEFLTDDQSHVFFSIMISQDQEEKLFATCSINLTKKGVKRIKLDGIELTHLETTFYLQTYYCRMFKDNISYIKIIDEARSVCDGDNERKNDYNLILYRILATKKPLEELSIYSRFYNHRDPVFTQKDRQTLMDIRKTIKVLLDFSKDKDCINYAKFLNDNAFTIFKVYEDFFNKIMIYNVKNEDSIYFVPIASKPFKHKKRSKSPKKRSKSPKKSSTSPKND